LGGVTGQEVEDYHDWEYILGHLGLLRYDHTIAHAAHEAGIALMLLSFMWGASLLFQQYHQLDTT
jgi:hypothetical protein